MRTEVQINEEVVDRPGVPPGLRDRYWWTWNGDAGLLGTTAQIGLPKDEHIATVEAGMVVATRQPSSDPWGETEIIVRDFVTGDVIRMVPTPLRSISVVLAGSRLVWTGELAGDPEAPVDGGVWAAGARNGSDPIEIVPGGREFPGALCGRGIVASPSGRTVAARALCNGSSLWTDIIDTETLTRTIRLREEWVLALTDDAYVLADFEPSDGVTWGDSGISAYSLEGGALRWRFPDPADGDRFISSGNAALGSSFVIRYFWRSGDETEIVHMKVHAATGQRTVLLREPYAGLHENLYAEFSASTPNHLVLTTGHDLGTLMRLRGIPISIIRMDDGTLLRDAFEIDPPWLCLDHLCREDT